MRGALASLKSQFAVDNNHTKSTQSYYNYNVSIHPFTALNIEWGIKSYMNEMKLKLEKVRQRRQQKFSFVSKLTFNIFVWHNIKK